MLLRLQKFISQRVTNVARWVRPLSTVTQGVHGHIGLITGNFSFFTKQEASMIEAALQERKLLVIVYDRDSIAVPANERAMWIREHFKHHPHLEVRVAYGPPPEGAGHETHYPSYIKKQLPADVQVISVHCKNPYSSLLAEGLRVPFVAQPGMGFKELEDRIKQDPASHESFISPIAIRRILSPFKTTIDAETFAKQCESESAQVPADMYRLNLGHPNLSTFFKRTKWDTATLNQINLPIIVGNINRPDERARFSDATLPQVFDMPIYMPDQGWKIPTELAPYQSVLAKIVAAESLANPEITECNAYVTRDSGVVFPDGLARRGGKHVDGFLTSANAQAARDKVIYGDNTYIVSDSPYLQTEFYPGPFDLRDINQDNPQAVLNAFEVQGRDMPYRQFNPYDIARLSTNNVHAVHPNLTHFYLLRSFLKVTFSERLFNRGGNTVNPNFNYRFVYVPRDNGRNTQNFIGVAPAGFEEVDLRDVDFTTMRFPQWLSSKPFGVSKRADLHITATPAVEGEMLTTEVNGHEVTTNIARFGDMKVSRTPKDSYFLGSNFRFLYSPIGKNKEYRPLPRLLKAAAVQKNVTFPAPWGTRQSIPAGGYIVNDPKSGEVWGVHKESFDATYQEQDSSLTFSP